MIPDFKTFISESVWTDIQKRSTGETVRKEDDIELLDMFGLYEYILANYELTDNRFEMTYGTDNMAIYVSAYGDEILLTYKFGEVHCFFNLSKPLYKELSRLFVVERNDEKHYVISPKESVTNKFYIDVLDCIIANKSACILKRKEKVSESIWTDIQKRSTGEQTRKEDILNDIYEYLTSKYNTTYSEDKIELDDEGIYIPIFKFYGTYASLRIYRDNINFSAINPNKYMDAPVKKMKDKLNTFYGDFVDNYSAKIEEFTGARDFWYTFELKPLGKKGTVTKEFCTDVIDFILENIDDKITKILKKKI